MHNTDQKAEDLKSGSYELYGEDERVQPVYLYAPNKKKLADDLGGWNIQWQEAIMILAKDKRMGLTDWRVLAVLQSRLDYDNWIRLSLSEIGAEISVAKSHVSTSMKKLLELGVVIIGPSVKNIKTYRLNPSISYKGRFWQAATERRKALKIINGGKSDNQESQLKMF